MRLADALSLEPSLPQSSVVPMSLSPLGAGSFVPAPPALAPPEMGGGPVSLAATHPVTGAANPYLHSAAYSPSPAQVRILQASDAAANSGHLGTRPWPTPPRLTLSHGDRWWPPSAIFEAASALDAAQRRSLDAAALDPGGVPPSARPTSIWPSRLPVTYPAPVDPNDLNRMASLFSGRPPLILDTLQGSFRVPLDGRLRAGILRPGLSEFEAVVPSLPNETQATWTADKLEFARVALANAPHTSRLLGRSMRRCAKLDSYLGSLPTPDINPTLVLFDRRCTGAWSQTAPLRDGLAALSSCPSTLGRWCCLTGLALRSWLYFHISHMNTRAVLSLRLRTRFLWSEYHVLTRTGRWCTWPKMSQRESVCLANAFAAAIREEHRLYEHPSLD